MTVFHPKEIVIAQPPDQEIPLDLDFMEEVAQALAGVADYDTHWMGREYASSGEEDARHKLEEYWDTSIANGDSIPYSEEELVSLTNVPEADDTIQVTSYELKINNVVIDKTKCYPFACTQNIKNHAIDINDDYKVVKTPTWWYLAYGLYENIKRHWDESEFIQFILDLLGKINMQNNFYSLDSEIIGNSNEITGNLVYIQDYENMPSNEGNGKIHLLEIKPNESDDSFYDKIKKVEETGGIGYIIITTNPIFLDTQNTTILGLAISAYDGEKIKQSLKDFDIVSIETTQNKLNVLCCNENPIGRKYIYHIDMNLFRTYNIDTHGLAMIWATKTLSWLFHNLTLGLYPKADAFIISDLRDDIHPLGPSSLIGDVRNITNPPELQSLCPIPGFAVDGIYCGSLSDEGTMVHMEIHATRNNESQGYNVIGTINGDGENPKDIVILSAHYDSLWTAGAIDDACAVSAVWGIAKYFSDNDIIPEYTIKCIAWTGEECICRGSKQWVRSHLVDPPEPDYNVKAIINMDPIAMRSGSLSHDIPFTPYIYPACLYNKIIKVMDRTNYEVATGHPFEYPDQHDRIKIPMVSDTEAFAPTDYHPEPFSEIVLTLERYAYEEWNKQWPGDLYVPWDHRSGYNFEYGDVWDTENIVDTNDLWYTANMVMNLSKFCAIDAVLDLNENGCTYEPEDLDLDGYNDSVKISYNITIDVSAWGEIQSEIYQNDIIQTKPFETGLMNIWQDNATSGELMVTLPPNASAGYCDIRVHLIDYRGNEDDFDNTTVYLYPYSNPLADFIYDLNPDNKKMINFTDLSLSSPNATLESWNWSFGDGNYSNQRNFSHNYSDIGTYNVTLVVTDNTNKTANITQQVETFNSYPVASFMTETNIVITNTTLTFTSDSSDVDGSIVNTTWYFGDNTTGYGEEANHIYNKSGIYTIMLKVTDNDNYTNYTVTTDYVLVADALVDDDFTDDPDAHKWDTITEGLNDVENGGVIYVFNGQYDPIEIEKSIALYGESRENVLISGGKPGIKIRYNNVSLSGFNVSSGTTGFDVSVKYDENHTSNVAIENCNIYGNSNVGILLNESNYCSIENCTIKGSSIGVKIMNNSTYNVIRKCTISQGTYGVYVSNSSHNYIGSPSISNPYPTDCTFTYNHNAIYLKNADYNFILGCDIDGTPYPGGVSAPTKGIYLNDSENNTISTCYIHDLTGKGVYFNDSTWNKIEHCKIVGNPNGVYFYNSPENLIVQNHFGINSEFAVYLPSDTQYNHIYYNDFFVNGNGSTNQSWDANGAKGAENLWSKEGNRTLTKEGRGEGNYWSDYTGSDNDQDGIGDTPYEILSGHVERNDSYPVMEPYGWCDFTQDSTPPVISNVSAEPSTVGFGYNVTIRAMVTDNASNISIVKVNIIYPDQSARNYTMDCIGGSLYQYTFTNTWTVGQYNYTIWAMDETYNSNSSSGHHFHVSAAATISIATLKDSYGANHYINITDPPNPPENYTLVARGLTWDEYYNVSSGCNVLEVSTGPVNYQEDDGTWTPINNSLNQLATDLPAYNYGYRIGNNRGLFGVYFKPNAQNDWPVAFAYNRSDDPATCALRSKLVGVGYVDPQSNWAYQYLQNVQSSQGQLNGNSMTYAGVFTGTDITWSYGNTELKEEITLSNETKTTLQNHPPSQYGLNNESSYLVFITKLDHQNLNIYNSSGILTGNVTISDAGVDFKDALGQFKCALPLGEAYELNNESMRQKLTYRIIRLNGNTYLLSGLKVSDLNAMTFPVVIDPTLSVNSISNDGYIYSSSTNYNTAWSASSGTVDSSATYLSIGQNKVSGFPTSTYYIYRGFVLFNTSSLPSNAYLDSAILSLYKKDDYSSTDFLLTIQNGQPTYPHNPLQASDYGKSHYSGNGGSLNTANFVNGRNNITLTNLNWINRNGTTKLCLRSSRDINGTAPTGNEYVNVYSANAPLVGYVPKLIITYRNQSKIKNTGFMDIKGYLQIQIQYYNALQGKWMVEDDTINETSARTINSGQQLALDTIFNGHVRTNDLTHNGSYYRVYAAFRDPEGNILKTNDDIDLAAWWQFTVLGIT